MNKFMSEALKEVDQISEPAEIALNLAMTRASPLLRKRLTIGSWSLKQFLWFMPIGVGLFFPRKANITYGHKQLIAHIVAEKRKGCAIVEVRNKRSRAGLLTCCDEGMIAVNVYYPTKGPYSKTVYMASPSFVCVRCLRYMDPCDYDPPMI